MEFHDVIASRHSVRQYALDPVEERDLLEILETAVRAPSAGNLQAFEIYVVTACAQRAALARASLDQGFLEQAPVVLVFCAHGARAAQRYGERGTHLYAVQDATIACTYAMLAATDMGLATVWVGAFDPDAVGEIVGAPAGHRPVALLPLGVAAEPPRRTPRRNLDDVVHRL